MTHVLIRTLSPRSGVELERIIAGEPDFTVVTDDTIPGGEAPDVILTEVDPAWEFSWDSLPEVPGGEPTIVFLTDDAPAGWTAAAVAAGVRGILPRTASGEETAAAVRAAAAGLIVFHPDDSGMFLPLRPPGEGAGSPAGQITHREREVLHLMADGLSNKEIAARLGISDHTAKFHVASIMGKLGATSRTGAVTTALRKGLLMV